MSRLLHHAVLLFCVFHVTWTQAASRPPNVIVILSDDQGWGDLSLNGNRNVNTPHLDQLARDGAQFDRFYVCPVCSPTRAEFLTGRYHPRGGVYSTSTGGERLDLDERTVADVFKQAGYATAAFGKWHNGMQYPYHPNGRGFDEFYGFCSGHWGDYFDAPLDHNGKLATGQGYLTDDFTNHAIEFVRQHRDHPFLVYLPLNTPHSPMQVPDRWWQAVAERPLPDRGLEPNKEDETFTRAALAMCENIDWNVGRILAELEELKLARETIVIYFCDNGPNSNRWNGGMKGRKGSTDEGGVRSPLLIRWPGTIPAETTVREIAGAIDLFPTLCDLAGIALPKDRDLDGVSLKSRLLAEGGSWPDRVLFSHWNGKVSARTQRFRLDHQGKLFDMQQDPGQKTPVNAAFPGPAARLTRQVNAWKQELLPGLGKDARRFPVGDAEYRYTQLPARDADLHGDLKRSSQHPNCSYVTNWNGTNDYLSWPIEVRAAGIYEVELQYTCPAESVGTKLRLACGTQSIDAVIDESHDPAPRGMEHDRSPRTESYVKDFKTLPMGRLRLEPGAEQMILRVVSSPASQDLFDFRLLFFTRATSN